MKLNDDAKIDIISSISDEHIEAVAAERIEAKAKVRHKQVLFRSVTTVAASFLLIIPSIILILFGIIGSGQVPIYKGMTVSNKAPEQIAYSSEYPYGTRTLSYMQDLGYSFSLLSMNEERKGRPLDDGLKDHFNPTVGEVMYYARPNEDIYISIQIENPENYEILSFTLNGNKYTSYMFEDGSDMTNIVLKVNVGDVSGLISYTIDAIKYVDGDKIKDVRMEGDRTVNIGVYSENQPTAAISDITFISTTVTFTASVLDPESLIAATNGKLYAIIYDGENVVAEKEITAGTDTDVLFEGLEPNTEYVAAVVAMFDAYDGLGTFPHLLYSEQFIAVPCIVARDITVVGNDVSFELYYANEEIVFTGLELTDWLGDVVYSTDSAVTEIKDIPAGKLTLRVSYKYTEDGVEKTGESETVFWCAEGMLPVNGKISFHYSDSPISPPSGNGYKLHQATELAPTTDDLLVYSISDGVVTNVIQYLPPAVNDGAIEILDGNGNYHYYLYLREIPFEVGDEVKVGDVLGELYSCGDLLLSGPNLHYACYTLSGNTKIYQCPAFDAPVKSESERISDMFEANPILLEGLTVSGKYGETVTVRVTFNTVVGDELVALYYGGSSDSRVELVRIEDNVWNLVCNFEGLTDEEGVIIEFIIFFDYYNTGSSFAVLLSPTDVPKEPNGTEIPDDGGDNVDEPDEDGDGILTIPEAIAAADGTQVVVRGIVSSVTEWNTTYNNNNVTIIDADGNTLFAFRLATKVCPGDEIIITGTIKTYVGMKEIAEGGTAEIVAVHGDNHTYVDGYCSVCGEIDPAKDL